MSRLPRARSARAFGALELAVVVLAGATSGCKNEEKSPAASASAAPSSSAAAAAAVPSKVPEIWAVPPLETARCRALRVKGTVKTEAGAVLAAMTPIDGNAWIELSPGSELVVRHSVSAREVLLRGPGNMLPCRKGEEHMLIESGTLTSTPGTGVRPGAEVWIATPFGTARYGDASVDITVSKAQWKLAAKSGSLWTDPPLTARGRSTSSPKTSPNARDEGRIQSGEHASSAGTPNPDALLATCQRLAEEARAGAERVASGAPGLGERAAAHLMQRKRARAACLSAAAGARSIGDAERRSRLDDLIRAADAAWERVPPPIRPTKTAREAPQ